MDEPTFENLRLWTMDTIVLYDWLMTLDFDAVPITHRAQKQALMDLLTSLEVNAPVHGVTEDEIRRAQAEVAKDMNW